MDVLALLAGAPLLALRRLTTLSASSRAPCFLLLGVVLAEHAF